MGILEGKRALIVGVASNKSIAWGVAKAMRREGAALAFTYQNERLQSRVEDFAAEAATRGLILAGRREMPSNNIMLRFDRA